MRPDFLSLSVCAYTWIFVLVPAEENVRATVNKSDWFTDGATAVRLNTIGYIVYSAAWAHTHTHSHSHTIDERKELFLDPCIVSWIAREASKLIHFHSAVKERDVVVVACGILNKLPWFFWYLSLFVLKCVFFKWADSWGWSTAFCSIFYIFLYKASRHELLKLCFCPTFFMYIFNLHLKKKNQWNIKRFSYLAEVESLIYQER